MQLYLPIYEIELNYVAGDIIELRTAEGFGHSMGHLFGSHRHSAFIVRIPRFEPATSLLVLAEHQLLFFNVSASAATLIDASLVSFGELTARIRQTDSLHLFRVSCQDFNSQIALSSKLLR